MRNPRIRAGRHLILPLLAGALLFPAPSARALESPCPSGVLQDRDTTALYLGESPPGAEPRLFARGIVSTSGGMYGTVVFSPGQDEAFWVKDEHPGLFFSRLVAGAWTAPAEFPFEEGYRLNSPFLSLDGNQLYFLAARRGPDGMDADDRIWVADRRGDGWGVPRELDAMVNSVKKHFQFSVDRNGSVYFGGQGADIYVSQRRDGQYGAPQRLSSPINTAAPETSPHISPDGSLLLFDRWFQEFPWVRIMASFRGPDGEWSATVDLSPYTKSEGNDSGARLSPDGRYLFFQSVREGSDPNRSVYWMDAGFLEELRRTSGPVEAAVPRKEPT